MPSTSAVLRWVRQFPEFRQRYVQARESLLEHWAEEITEIADDGSNDWMERRGEEGAPAGWVANGEHIQRSRLRVDTRKWLLSKLAPKKYGDRVNVTNSDGSFADALAAARARAGIAQPPSETE